MQPSLDCKCPFCSFTSASSSLMLDHLSNAHQFQVHGPEHISNFSSFLTLFKTLLSAQHPPFSSSFLDSCASRARESVNSSQSSLLTKIKEQQDQDDPIPIPCVFCAESSSSLSSSLFSLFQAPPSFTSLWESFGLCNSSHFFLTYKLKVDHVTCLYCQRDAKKKDVEIRFNRTLQLIDSLPFSLELIYLRTVMVTRFVILKSKFSEITGIIALFRNHLDSLKEKVSVIIESVVNQIQQSIVINDTSLSTIKKMIVERVKLVLNYILKCFCVAVGFIIENNVKISGKISEESGTKKVSKRRLDPSFYYSIAASVSADLDQNLLNLERLFENFSGNFELKFSNELLLVDKDMTRIVVNINDLSILTLSTPLIDFSSTSELYFRSINYLIADYGKDDVYSGYSNQLLVQMLSCALSNPSKFAEKNLVEIFVVSVFPHYFSHKNLAFSSIIGTVLVLGLRIFMLPSQSKFLIKYFTSDSQSNPFSLLYGIFCDYFISVRNHLNLMPCEFSKFRSYFLSLCPQNVSDTENLNENFKPLVPIFHQCSPFNIAMKFSKSEYLFPRNVEFEFELFLDFYFPTDLKFSSVIFNFSQDNRDISVLFTENLGQNFQNFYGVYDIIVPFSNGNKLFKGKSIIFDCEIDCKFVEVDSILTLSNVILSLDDLSLSLSDLIKNKSEFSKFKTKFSSFTLSNSPLSKFSNICQNFQNSCFYKDIPFKADFEISQIFPQNNVNLLRHPSIFELNIFSFSCRKYNLEISIEILDKSLKAQLFLENLNDSQGISEHVFDLESGKFRKIYLVVFSISENSNADLKISLKNLNSQSHVLTKKLQLNFVSAVTHSFKNSGELILNNTVDCTLGFKLVQENLDKNILNLEQNIENLQISTPDSAQSINQVNQNVVVKGGQSACFFISPHNESLIEWSIPISSNNVRVQNLVSIFDKPTILALTPICPPKVSTLEVTCTFPKKISRFVEFTFLIEIKSLIDYVDCFVAINNTEDFLISGLTKLIVTLKPDNIFKLELRCIALKVGFLDFPRVSFSHPRNSQRLAPTQLCSLFCFDSSS
ncbi:hypothetical protein RCL1_008040 [Eukaryota sp. TZLM3-RCL]